jgi:N-acetylneuraminic acid mutarotase
MKFAALPLFGLACALAANVPARAQDAHAHGSGTAAPAPPSASALSWQTGPVLGRGRDHHTTVLVENGAGASLFVAGGTDYAEVFQDVWRLRLRRDGTADRWEQQRAALPAPRAGAGVSVAANHIVVTGGFYLDPAQPNVPQKTSTTYVASLRPDGSIREWKTAAALPAVRYHHASVAHGDWVYVTGGIGERIAEPTVFAAKVAADGTLREWTALTAMPNPRSHHSSFVREGHLYVVGGLANHPGLPLLHVDVSRAKIKEDGTLERWQTVSFTPHAYATHSSFVSGRHLYLVGGVEDNVRFTDAVWRAPFLADGRMGPWEEVKPGLPAPRAHVHNTPVWNGRMFSVGGSASRKVRTALDIATLPTP